MLSFAPPAGAAGAVVLFAGLLAPARAQTQAPVPVVLSATVNGALQPTVRPGWPLLLRVDALHPALDGSNVTPIFLSSPSGVWSDALRVTVTNADGARQSWSFQPGGEHGFEAVLTADASASAAYWIDGAATAAFAPGVYTLSVRLDSTAVRGSAAKSAPVSVPVRITVAAGAAIEADAREHALLSADLAVLVGDEARARGAVEAWLDAHPSDAGALAYRADLLQASGAYAEAEAAFERALHAYQRQTPHLPEPLAVVAWARRAAEAAHAGDIAVTFGAKGANHPYRQRGGTDGFALNGVPGAEWLLVPGESYAFRVDALPDGQTFGLFRDPEARQPYTAGVERATESSGDVLRFNPDASTPAVLYYGSSGLAYAGGVLRLDHPVERATPVVPESPVLSVVRLVGPFPNPARVRATFTLGVPAAQRVRAEAFDVLGHRVAYLLDEDVAPGTYTFPFDTSALASGTYVVRVTVGNERHTRRVIVP